MVGAICFAKGGSYEGPLTFSLCGDVTFRHWHHTCEISLVAVISRLLSHLAPLMGRKYAALSFGKISIKIRGKSKPTSQ